MSPLRGFNVKGVYDYYKYFTPNGVREVFDVWEAAANSQIKNNFRDARFASPTSYVSRFTFGHWALVNSHSLFVIWNVEFVIWNFFLSSRPPRLIVSGSKKNHRIAANSLMKNDFQDSKF